MEINMFVKKLKIKINTRATTVRAGCVQSPIRTERKRNRRTSTWENNEGEKKEKVQAKNRRKTRSKGKKGKEEKTDTVRNGSRKLDS